MKVLQINALYGFGSTGVIVQDLCNAIYSCGDEAIVAYQFANPVPQKGYKIGNRLDWKMHAIYTRLTGKQAFASRQQTKKLISYIQRETPDIVHIHNIHANYINIQILFEFLAEASIPTVLTLHDCWFFTGKCCHFAAIRCDKWKEKCGHCPKLKESPSSVFVDPTEWVLSLKKQLYHEMPKLTVVGCSRWITDIAKSSAAFKGVDVQHIPNGVDLDTFIPSEDRKKYKEKLGIIADFVIMGMANKWLDKKNEMVLKDVIEQLKDDEELLLLGCSDEQKVLLKQYKRVLPIGFISDRKTLMMYYNIADVFVNLTFEDTLPTVNMEATACGTPVITYDCCGSPELVRDEKTGFIIQPLDIQALNACLHRIKNGDILRNDCRVFAEQSFNKTERYKQYLTLYRGICNHSS